MYRSLVIHGYPAPISVVNWDVRVLTHPMGTRSMWTLTAFKAARIRGLRAWYDALTSVISLSQ